MNGLRLTYSLADQNFGQTKSIGIFNYSCQMLEVLGKRPEIERLTVLANSTITPRLGLPEKVRIRTHDEAIKGRWNRIWWDQLKVYQAAQTAGDEWLFLPKGFASFVRRCPIRLATCVADGMQDHYRRNYPTSVSRFESIYFERCFRATLRYSTIIFTISDFTSSEVARLARAFPFPAPPIKTIGIGFFPPGRRSEFRRGMVIPAGKFPHKKTALAIGYVSEWQRRTDFKEPINWVGALPTGSTLPNWPHWRLHSRLPEAEYRDLIRQARALIYFSDYEGFGMPPVEGAIAGACPVYSDLPVTREVMAGTGFAFDNSSCENFIEALDNALKTRPETIAAWGEALLRKHSMDSVIDRFINGLSQAQKPGNAKNL